MSFLDLGTLSGELRTGGFIPAHLIKGGTITAQTIIIAGGTQGVIRSQNYNGTTAGWAVFGDGSAKFLGALTIGSSLILDISSAKGDIFQTSDTLGTVAAVNIGTATQLLATNSAADAVEWVDAPTGAEFSELMLIGA